jgi:transcriptional regulator with XRE-family HTH domain
MHSFDTYSQRLRSARLAANVTQAQLADAAGGVASTFVSAVENGAVERLVAVLDARLAERAQAGDPVAQAARERLPNTWAKSDLRARLDAHLAEEAA